MFSRIDNFIDELNDNRSKGSYSIWEQIGIVAIYIILVKKIGPWYMENRKPFNVKKIVMVFDAIQIVANFYFVVSVLQLLPKMQGTYFCLELDSTDSPVGRTSLYLTKFYYWLKISDLLDTVFFVLKKSWRQVSYLHVYHHSVMIIFSWMGIKLVPGGHLAYFGLANAVVHTVMYTYYLLSAYDQRYSQYLSLKKSITRMQLIQFIFLLIVYTPTIFTSCSFPKIFGIATSTQASYFLYLFGKFYYESYIKINPDGQQKNVKHK